MRIIKNWTKEEIEEFNKLKNDYCGAMSIIYRIVDRSDLYPKLYDKYILVSEINESEFAQDIIDLLTDEAQFEEPKYQYALKDIKDLSNNPQFLVKLDDGRPTLATKFDTIVNDLKPENYEFTEDEALMALSNTTLAPIDFNRYEVTADD